MSNQFPIDANQRHSFSPVGPSNPMGEANAAGQLTVSEFKLKQLRGDLFGIGGTFKHVLSKFGIGVSPRQMIEATLAAGESQPAIVISLNPLLISAYSDEFDAVVLLDVPIAIKPIYGLELGTRLLISCFHVPDHRVQEDIIVGPGFSKRWQVFLPVIADFVSADYAQIRQLKQRIPEDKWHKAWYMGLAYRQQRPGHVRFGLPGLSMVPAIPPANAIEASKSIYDRM